MELWRAFGEIGNRSFTCFDAERELGRNVQHGLKGLINANVIHHATPPEKDRVKHRNGCVIVNYQFSQRFQEYMLSEEGIEELHIALAIVEQRKAACA